MNSDEGNQQVSSTLDPTVDFIAGTVAGMAGLVVGFPFDTVKVRFQSPQVSQKYRSTAQALATIVREERFLGLYKGITSPLATCALMNGLVFSSYRFLMKLQLDDPDSTPSLSQIALAGAGSGIISSIITTPTELIKIQQQNMLSAASSAPSARALAVQIFRAHGLKGLYRGVTATALRDCGYGAYFAAYEATCRYLATAPPTLHSDHSSILSEIESEMSVLSWPALLAAGGVAGIAGWITTFPLDVIKTRIQGSAPVPGSSRPVSTDASPRNPYRTTLSTISHSYRAEGGGVFFRGLAPTLIRAVPVNMATFAVFEAVVHALA
ncbi:hypothetical protein PLICRDRAFT_178337 [Plicaturopsis crispa FD-325 SS-3]|nr:hypothetical protein PLICRDRAFT_178337 [Plicaturopsis crispa FD-325 SS-3]